ncbi:MAG: PHP domain-containing protein [Ruminococcaceae bacterium]|nr:PHP domain-containing protein [Oscillospiraceae bacterium]
MNITHDFHVHTYLSPCGKDSATLDAYMKQAKRLGLKKMGFADHYWDENIPMEFEKINCLVGDHNTSSFYTPSNTACVLSLKKQIDALSPAEKGDLKIYLGCEVEYDPIHRGPALSEEHAEQFDFVIAASSHTHMMMPKDLYHPWEKHMDFMVQAYEDILNSSISRYITSLVHPFEICCAPYDDMYILDRMPADVFHRVFDKTANKDIAVEVNVYSFAHMDQNQIADSSKFKMLQIAKKCGCKFTFGSDSHTNVGHENYEVSNLIADMLGLKECDLPEIVK